MIFALFGYIYCHFLDRSINRSLMSIKFAYKPLEIALDNAIKDLEYNTKKKEFDTKFIILVEKGGLDKQVYENHRHFYCLGYYS